MTGNTDTVLQPAHYNAGGIECIDAIRAALGEENFKHYCRGQVLKYLWRAEHKGRAEEDYQKAMFYGLFLVGKDPRTLRVTDSD
jgi:hypothetical protein